VSWILGQRLRLLKGWGSLENNINEDVKKGVEVVKGFRINLSRRKDVGDE